MVSSNLNTPAEIRQVVKPPQDLSCIVNAVQNVEETTYVCCKCYAVSERPLSHTLSTFLNLLKPAAEPPARVYVQ